MGHDITGYKPSDTKNDIAYLRRGAFNELNKTIYDALNCHECGGGWSGYGVERTFTKEELSKGLAYLGNNEDFQPEITFIKECIANVDERGNILISFS